MESGGFKLEEPTALQKCKVGASASSPLVTEWPGSEKAHLESMLHGRAVAVEYSGCELHLLDDCSVPGDYDWSPTSVSTDSASIRSENELFAKLPLGAVSLEGALKQHGSLVVQTTVVGQMRLRNPDTSKIARTGACGKATHIVRALSVGAFKLLGGKEIKGQAGVSVAGVEVGGGAARGEELLRESGSQAACSEPSKNGAPRQCSSPVQIFLTPIERDRTEEEKATAIQEEKDKKEGVQVKFESPDPTKPWSLRTKDGKFLCDLPCERWVGPESGFFLYKQAALVANTRRIQVVDHFAFTAGSHADGRWYDPPSRWHTVGIVATAVLGGLTAYVGYELTKSKLCTYKNGETTTTIGDECPIQYSFGGSINTVLTSGQDAGSAQKIHQTGAYLTLAGGAVALLGAVGWAYWLGGQPNGYTYKLSGAEEEARIRFDPARMLWTF